MGVEQLFPRLEHGLEKTGNLKELLRNKRLAIDASVWLHMLISRYCEEYVLAHNRSIIVTAFYDYVCAIRREGVDCIIVFDNICEKMPGKCNVDADRAAKRAKAQEAIKAAVDSDTLDGLPLSTVRSAACIDEELLHLVMTNLHETGVKFLIAPFQADHQLASLMLSHHVHAVFTTDSDLLVHGVTLLIRRMQFSSEGLCPRGPIIRSVLIASTRSTTMVRISMR